MPPVNVQFGQLIRKLREEKRKTNPAFSLRRFAQEVGVSAAYLSKLEMGEALPPKAEKIKVIAKLLETDADELLALAGKVDPILPELIREKPRMADFLRSAREADLTNEQIEALTQRVKNGDF
ncbi:MAG: helix-turn-helix domain-containing protein [Acidobacteriota bacterium]|nr:helix-turn-helix domain-containing protein [Acidobacteriota bacterium]